jgi:hypothetical protein
LKRGNASFRAILGLGGNIMKATGCAVIGALFLAVPAYAQTAAPVVAMPIADTQGATLRVGTEVPLKLSEELTTKGKKLKINQRFHLEVAEPVIVQGVVAIPAGSPAVGEITEVRNKGMWGKSGHFTGRVLYVMVNGRQVRLSGTFDDKGVVGGVGAVAVSAVVFLPAGFFMTGTSARLAAGTAVKAFVDEEVPLAIVAAAAPAPLVVQAATLVEAQPVKDAKSTASPQ